MEKPRALDLFCGAGGATKGLQWAGFHVTGIDNRPQPRYCGDAFILADALDPPVRLEDFDLLWASPPCQAHTPMSNRWRGKGGLADTRQNLITSCREMILAGDNPWWVIENVYGSRRHFAPNLTLWGEMFGLQVHRPRLFETTFVVMEPPRVRRQSDAVAVYGKPDGRRLYDRADGSQLKAWTVSSGASAMRIDWMDEPGLREAIPPAYAEHIGRYAMMALGRDPL